jgi:hypothetical protein
MLRSAGIISHVIAKSWELSKWIQQRSIVVRADEEGAGRRAKRRGQCPSTMRQSGNYCIDYK